MAAQVAPARGNMMMKFFKEKIEAVQEVKEELSIMDVLPERKMNYYALFMDYQTLAITGLRYVILAWSGAVLLGGFVASLETKDFLSLSVIMLIQTIGILDVSSDSRLRNIRYGFFGLLVSMLPSSTSFRSWDAFVNASTIVGLLATLFQTLVVVLVLGPLGAAYVFWPLISAGLAVWRLVQRDYVAQIAATSSQSTGQNEQQDDKKNLTPALIVLYSLAVIQGFLCVYRWLLSLRRTAIARHVADRYGLADDKWALRAAQDYFRDAWSPDEDGPFDPSRPTRRTLITYAADLLESSGNYRRGVRLMGALLRHFEDDDVPIPGYNAIRGKEMKCMAKTQLLGSPSSGNLIAKLLWTLDPATSPMGTAAGAQEQGRLHAAYIVGILAREIRLKQFPHALRRIESLLDSDVMDMKKKGLSILAALAADEENRQAMRREMQRPIQRSLLHRIMDAVNMVLSDHQRMVDEIAALVTPVSYDDRRKIHRSWAMKVARPPLGLLILVPIDSTQAAANNNNHPDQQQLQQLREDIRTRLNAVARQNIIDCCLCQDAYFNEAATRSFLDGLPGDEAQAIKTLLPSI